MDHKKDNIILSPPMRYPKRGEQRKEINSPPRNNPEIDGVNPNY